MNTRHTDRDRTIALAGIFQAAHLVTELASEGRTNPEAMRISIDSLFVFSPATTAAVYGGEQCVSEGLRVLLSQLEQPGQRDLLVARYAIALIHHADKLLKEPKRFHALGQDLEALRESVSGFDLGDASRSTQLARIYQQHISPVQPRIMVQGEPLYLQNPKIADQIRALLLAGIRAAVLWRQCQGKRWQLFVRRRQIAAIARALLNRVAA